MSPNSPAAPILAAACFVWAGMVLGISFLEASVKFTAPSLTLPVGLDVGRHVFAALNRVEMGWAVLTFVLALVGGGALGRRACAMLVASWAVVAVQTLWLLPALGARTDRIIGGEALPPSNLHVLYIGVEVVKLLALLGAGGFLLVRLHRAAGPSASAT
jgi:hypothetical protein